LPEFRNGDRVEFSGAQYTYDHPDGHLAILKHDDGYPIAVPHEKLVPADDAVPALQGDELLRQVIYHDAEEVLPQWLVETVCAVLEDFLSVVACPDGILDLALAIHTRFENQFDPKLIAHLREWGAQVGPNGVALAAASLTPWPALAERMVGADLPASHKQETMVVGHEQRMQWLRDLQHVVSANATATWEQLIASVRELRTVAEAGPERMSEALRNQTASALGFEVDTKSWPELFQEMVVLSNAKENPALDNWRKMICRVLNDDEVASWDEIIQGIRERQQDAMGLREQLALLRTSAAKVVGLSRLATLPMVLDALEKVPTINEKVNPEDLEDDLDEFVDEAGSNTHSVTRKLLEKFHIFRKD
jgi:hypothetical protein